MDFTGKDLETVRSSANGRHRELVHRVVSSATFAKSKRLSSFLYYICEQTLNGRLDEVNEQRIGEEVFGRTRDYNSSIDGIVRTQGSRLRQRLDRYFSEEGAAEPIRILIPRGGYVPIFEPRFAPEKPSVAAPSPIEPEAAAQAPVAPAAALPVSSAYSPLALWALLIVVLGLGLVLYLRHRRYIAQAATSAGPLWSQMFVEGQRTLVVPGDSGLVIWEGLTGRRLSLNEFLKGDYHKEPATGPQSVQLIADDLSNRRYTTVVDLEVLDFLSRIAKSDRSRLQLRYARDLRPNDLKEGNVILIGANEANPWVELYEPEMTFVFSKNPATNRSSIENRAPRNGEPSRWDLSDGRAYALVDFLPGLTDHGNALLIGGTSMTGTESALDFISDDTQLLTFLKRIQRPDGRLPHFQVVLGTQGVTGSSVHSQILAWRVMD